MAIAFIGLGEAGGLLAAGLIAAGADVRSAYDILIDDPATAPALQEKARGIGLEATPSSAEAIAGADIVISAVTSKEMVNAAKTAAPNLKPGQVYLDINSAAPSAKREAAAAIAPPSTLLARSAPSLTCTQLMWLGTYTSLT